MPDSARSLNKVMSGGTPFSPAVSTPSTPLTRGGMGYMGAGTMKALRASRSVSIGHIASFNNPLSIAGSAAPSVQSSPAIGPLEVVGTSCSMRSHQSMPSDFGPGFIGPSSTHLLTPAEADAAEQSMGEHLRAIRRRSCAEVMNSPRNSEDPVAAMMAKTEAMFAPGLTPSPITPSSSRGAFRMSFSTPNLNPNLRRTSLGLKSVLNSIVSS
jgi:hypothetical protein